MYCGNCGAQNPDNASHCTSCGRPLAAGAPVPQQGAAPAGGLASVPNYLIQSILVTIFCCLPAGVVSIVYAAQVNSKLAMGDMQGAMQASKNAKTWAMVSAGIGLAGLVLYIILMAAGALTFGGSVNEF